MNKLLLILFFLFCSNVGATDTLAVAKKEKAPFTQDHIQVDSSVMEIRTFAKNFKKKYTDDAFKYEFKTPEKNAWDRFKEWLAAFFKNLFHFSSNATALGFVGALLKILAVLILVFVVYLITNALLNKEGQWIFGRNSDKKRIDHSEIEKNLHRIDFEKLIQGTLETGEMRLSIRYYYLWLLKSMSEKNWIVWDIEKTNSDYLYELKNQSQKDEFAYLSYLYNYIWYGEFDLDEDTFAKAKTAFEKTIKSIGNE